MTHKKTIALSSLLVPAALAVFAVAYADSEGDMPGPYKLLTTISIPDLVGFDISWVDSSRGRYYLADRGTATTPPTPRIDVINTENDKLVDQIPLSTAGNGVVAIRSTGDDDGEDQPGMLVVGGADSTAIFIDLAHPHAVPFAVRTGGTQRADELAFDPVHHLILIANDRAVDSFVTFISTKNPPHVVGQILYNGKEPGGLTANGIEQPVWDGKTGKFYLAIPETNVNKSGEVDEIDPVGMKITRTFVTTCGPAGLVLIPGQHLMTSCGDVLDIATGKVVHTVAGVGGDEIWFNRGDDRVYFGGGLDRISVPVVSGVSPYNLITNLVVGVLNTAPTPSHTTHSVAADSENNRIFVPVSHEGVKVYARDDD